MNYFKRKFILKRSKKPRESGNYWVKWSGLAHNSPAVWRMGSYGQHIGWKLAGDERLYQDENFLEINENRIPLTEGRLFSGFWFWIAVIANYAAAAYYIFYLLTHR